MFLQNGINEILTTDKWRKESFDQAKT